MVEIISEFVVKQGIGGQFELAFGPGGAWGRLFARYQGFRGTALMRDTKDPRRYLAIDFWTTGSEREQALAECQVEYSRLEAEFADWTESRTEVGAFSVLAEATVRPRARVGRATGARASRRPRRTTR
jgi:hypothetical protein